MSITKLIIMIFVVVVFWAIVVSLLTSKKVRVAVTKLAFMPDGSFSLTRLIMGALAFSSVLLIWIGVIASLLFDKSLPNNLYTYAAGLTGGGILQYGVTKFTLLGKGGTNEQTQNDMDNQ